MRLSYLTASSIPSRAANAVHVMKMAQAFRAAGNEVTLFARHGQEQTALSDHDYFDVGEDFEIVKHTWPGVPVVGGIAYASSVRRDVVSRTLPDLFYSRNPLTLASIAGVQRPMRLEVHALPENAWQSLAVRRVLSAPNLDVLVTISDALREAYLEMFPRLRDKRVVVAHDGADCAASLAPTTSEREMVVSALPAARAHVGYVGHLYPGKGMELIEQLARYMPAVAFHVVGGTDEDIAGWRARSRGAGNLVFHGHVPHGRVQGFLRALDIVLAPYQRKVGTSGGKGDIARWMSPLKLFEYMAFRKPIVVSDLPVLKEVIVHEHNGLLCGPSDVGAWVEAIERLISEPALADRIATNAHHDFLARYTWERRARHVLA